MKERNLPEVVEVVWEDSTTQHGWNKSEEALEVVPDFATSVGFLIEETPKLVRIAKSTVHVAEKDYERSSRFSCVTVIPRSAVRSMRRLRKARK